MKKTLAALALAMPLLIAAPALADDAVSTHEVANVLQRPDFSGQMSGVQFFFGDSAHPSVARTVEPGVTTSVRTRKFGRSDEEACQWVMLTALINLREHAMSVGGNAVVNVRSNWRNIEWSSATQYQCAAGFLMAGVALKGDVVTLH